MHLVDSAIMMFAIAGLIETITLQRIVVLLCVLVGGIACLVAYTEPKLFYVPVVLLVVAAAIGVISLLIEKGIKHVLR